MQIFTPLHLRRQLQIMYR